MLRKFVAGPRREAIARRRDGCVAPRLAQSSASTSSRMASSVAATSAVIVASVRPATAIVDELVTGPREAIERMR
jgi:hypothetical protein